MLGSVFEGSSRIRTEGFELCWKEVAKSQLHIALALVKIKFAQGQMQEELLTPLAV